METLKHPSASVNPDNQASCNVGKIRIFLNLIVFAPKRLFKTRIHKDNCLTLLFIVKLPLNR
jgi:hypothetical protein